MSNVIGRIVTIARFHSAIHFEGVGSLSSPVTPITAKDKGGLVLTKVEGGLLVQAPKLNKALFVPDGNIQTLQLAPIAK